MKNILDLKVYKIYDVNNGYFIRTFDTFTELLEFLARHQHVDSWWGEYRPGLEGVFGYCNTYLDDVNMNFNDKKYVSRELSPTSYWIRSYLFLDEENRIFDPRKYINEIIDIIKNNKFTKRKRYGYRCFYESQLPDFRKGPVPGTGVRHNHRGSYYRHPKTMNEKRQSANVEYKEYIPPKKHILNIPDAWDEIPRSKSKSWKDQTKKRKQWM